MFRERYIQNPDIFRMRSIFRTLVYLEPETCSEHLQTSTIEQFAKIIQILSFKSIETSF